MTPMEILHRIVETEETARTVYQEAVGIRENFDKYVQEHIDAIRKERFRSVDKAIAEFAVTEHERADEAIVQLDEKLNSELAAAKQRYEQGKDEAVQKIFKLAVGIDA